MPLAAPSRAAVRVVMVDLLSGWVSSRVRRYARLAAASSAGLVIGGSAARVIGGAAGPHPGGCTAAASGVRSPHAHARVGTLTRRRPGGRPALRLPRGVGGVRGLGGAAVRRRDPWPAAGQRAAGARHVPAAAAAAAATGR